MTELRLVEVRRGLNKVIEWQPENRYEDLFDGRFLGK